MCVCVCVCVCAAMFFFGLLGFSYHALTVAYSCFVSVSNRSKLSVYIRCNNHILKPVGLKKLKVKHDVWLITFISFNLVQFSSYHMYTYQSMECYG